MTHASPEPFSLLLPVYAGDHPKHLRRAFESATTEQTLPPDEVVIVQDGPLPTALSAELDRLEEECPIPVQRVRLSRNRGLAIALQEGLQHCSFDIVARADADDVCVPERFAIQVPMIADGLDVVGSALAEFQTDETVIEAVRRRPTESGAIRRFASFHNPVNHPSVVYRRSAVLAAGGYQEMPLMEDYWLWARMIVAGAAIANVEEALVRYRAGSGLYSRRGGLRALRSDWAFQQKAHEIGLTTRVQMVRNLVQRFGYRVVPDNVRKWGYRLLVARH